MKNKKIEGLIILFTGLLILFFAWFIYFYFIYTPVSNTDSSRLKDLNRPVDNLGKLPTAIIAGVIGIFACLQGIKRINSKADN